MRDTTAFSISLLVLLVISVALLLGVGVARDWNVALVPPYKFQFFTVEDATRFWPEPNEYPQNSDIDAEIPGRNFAQASGLWYYWKFRPSNVEYCNPEPFDPVTEPWILSCEVPQANAGTRAFVWCCYIVHQCLVWGLIYKAQSLHKNDTNYHSHLQWYNVASMIVNCIMYLLHLVQTHVTYDALAQDVTEASSQGSVILLLVMVLIMEYKQRGLFLGWPAWNNEAKCCGCNGLSWRLPSRPIELVRKYHGYAFAWATIYTTWYHPMESTAAHVTGFLHTGLLLIQQSLIFTPLHLNKYWRLVLETWVVIHSAVVAAQTQGRGMIGMFLFGFLWMLAFTQIHGLPYYLAFCEVDASRKESTFGNNNAPSESLLADYLPLVPIKKWKRLVIRIIPVILYFIFVIASYLTWLKDDAKSLGSQMSEIIRIPLILYLLALFLAIVAWGMLAVDSNVSSCGCCRNKNNGDEGEKNVASDDHNDKEEKPPSNQEPQKDENVDTVDRSEPTKNKNTDVETPIIVEQQQHGATRKRVGSIGTGTVLAVLFVGYAIMIAVSVIVEAVHVQMDLIMLMVVLVVIFSVLSLMVMIVMERGMRRIELGGPTGLPPVDRVGKQAMAGKEASIDDSKEDYSPAQIVANE